MSALSVEAWDTARAEHVEVYPDPAAMMRAEAERVVTLTAAAIAEHGRCSLALAGGSTPRPLYELLATPRFASRIDWSRVHLFWGDERCVLPEHPDSNFRMAREALLDRVPVPWGQVHRIAGEEEPGVAAHMYENTLRAHFGVADGPPIRTFDLVLLGMGTDGHTASLFPGTPALAEDRRWVVPNRADASRDQWRITLTPVALNASRAVTFLVAGDAKAERIWEVLEGPPHAPRLPVEQIHPANGDLTWMIDAAAGRRLGRTTAAP
jgi:6-phosphogluconolactonase